MCFLQNFPKALESVVSMDAQTQGGIKCLVQFVKQALQNCLTHKRDEERRLYSHQRGQDFVRSRSLCSSVGDVPGSPVRFAVDPERRPEVAEGPEAESCDEEVMTFQKLPYECKLNIFSFLSATERGMAERVCHDWKDVLRSPTLWTDIDLSLSRAFQRKNPQQVDISSETSSDVRSPGEVEEFKTATSKSKPEAEAEYEKYKSCISGYVEYLGQIKPCVKNLSFSFDIGDSQDGWTQVLKNFFDSARTKNTKTASFNWKDTSAKPSALLDSSNTWSTGNYSDLMYKQRRRQRLFVSFFDSFTALVPNLESLSLPFDWSVSSVGHLARLGPTLSRLSLEEYFVPQPLDQCLLDRLLANLPNLERLSVGLVLGSGLGVFGYEFSSSSLRSLDLSKCQGFALMKVDLPNLKELRTSNASFPSQLVLVSSDAAGTQNAPRTEQRGQKQNREQDGRPPLKSSKSSPALSLVQAGTQKLPIPLGIPCLFNVLKKGAPSLEKLNDHELLDDWRDAFDPKLEKILHQACSCLYHHRHHSG